MHGDILDTPVQQIPKQDNKVQQQTIPSTRMLILTEQSDCKIHCFS